MRSGPRWRGRAHRKSRKVDGERRTAARVPRERNFGLSATATIRPIHVAGLLVLSLAWGSAFLFTEVGIRTLPPLTLAAARIVGASILLWLVVWRQGHRIPREARTWLLFLLAGFNGNALPFALTSWGQVRIDSNLAAILIATAPLFTLLLMHFVTDDDRITPRKALGIGIGFLGVVLLLGIDALGELGATVWGQFALLGASISFAITYLWARQLKGIPVAVTSASVLLCAAAWTVPASLAVDKPWALAPSTESLLAAAALALISTGAANLLFFWLVAATRPSFVSLTNYLLPAIAVAWGVLLLGEVITLRSVAAFLIILSGVALTSMSGFGGSDRASTDGSTA